MSQLQTGTSAGLSPSGLKRSISMMHLLMLGTGGIIGPFVLWSGWWFSMTGPALPLSFLIIGLMCIPIGLVYAELVSMMPYVGNELIFCSNGVNKNFGFFASWSILLPWMISGPAVVMGILEYLNFAMPNVSITASSLLVIIILLIYTLINSRGLVQLASLQTIMVFIIVAGVIAGFVYFISSGHWTLDNFQPFFQSALPGGGISGWVVGTGMLITMFFGFEIIPQLIEDTYASTQKIYKLIIGSISIAAFLYILIAIADAGMMPWAQLTGNGSGEPFVEIRIIMEVLNNYPLAMICGIIGVLLTLLTCLAGFWAAAVRMLFAMGQYNFLPKSFGSLNKNNVPGVANWATLAFSILFVFLISGISWIQGFFTAMGLGASLAYVFTMIAALKIELDRKNRTKDWERPFKLPGGMAMRVTALVFSIVIFILVSIGQTPETWLLFGVYVLIGLSLWLYLKLRYWKTPGNEAWVRSPGGEKRVL